MKLHCGLIVVSLFLTSSPLMSGQKQCGSQAMQRATIAHSATTMVICAHDPRPLRQAIEALTAEYGWVVDYEDPIYSSTDLVDATAPSWRASHPDGPGVTRPRGERFESSMPEPRAMNADGEQRTKRTLEALVAAYNASGNPGVFSVTEEGNKRFAIVGQIRSGGQLGAKGLFDVRIDLESKTRTGDEALAAIFDAVSHVVGKKVGLGFAPMGLLLGTPVEIGGPPVEIGGRGIVAREAIAKVLDGTRANLVWEALYAADPDMYLVNIALAIQSHRDI
jgi:hypothetical protein